VQTAWSSTAAAAAAAAAGKLGLTKERKRRRIQLNNQTQGLLACAAPGGKGSTVVNGGHVTVIPHELVLVQHLLIDLALCVAVVCW
jgi:hypothetical protein